MARPLTKKHETGVLYTRPNSIEATIDNALTQDRKTLSQRAQVTHPGSADYLPSECLVHLIRDAIRRNDQHLASALMPPLLVRCEANLKRTVPDRGFRNAEGIREEILSSFALLFTEEADEEALDYYECKFNRAFRSLRINHVRNETRARRHLTDLPEVTTADGELMLDADLLAKLSQAAKIGPGQEDHVYLPQVLKAIDELPPDQRRAFVLRRLIGDIEKDVAANEGVDARTIRNRVERADAQLKKLKEDL
jgi:hypothetical protein